MTDESKFGMKTQVNGLEIITGETSKVNVKLNDEGVSAYMGKNPFVSLVRGNRDGKPYVFSPASYLTIEEAAEGHMELVRKGSSSPRSIRHDDSARNLADGWLLDSHVSVPHRALDIADSLLHGTATGAGILPVYKERRR